MSAVFSGSKAYVYPWISVTDAKDCTIRLSRPMVVHADGEYCGEVTEVHFHCLPGKLRVLK